MTPRAPALDVSGLAYAWGRRSVLAGLGLEVARGEHVALLGPNGSGKSTALQLLAGLLRPSAGRIDWRLGADADDAAPPRPPTYLEVRARLGVVFQHPSLDLALTPRENLLLAARMAALPRGAARARVADLITWSGLDERADQRARELSGGMRRRLDLARALVADPEALLLDEPTAGLDAEHFERFWSRLDALRRARGLTIVTATHRPDEARLADRLVMIAGGRAIHTGTPEETIRLLGKDVLVVTARDPEDVADVVRGRLHLVARVVGADIVLEVPTGEDAARLLVRVVELFAPGRLDAIVLRRPTLADAFVRLAGEPLREPMAEAA